MRELRHILVLFKPASPLALRTRHRILFDLPYKALFELEASFLAERLGSPIQPY